MQINKVQLLFWKNQNVNEEPCNHLNLADRYRCSLFIDKIVSIEKSEIIKTRINKFITTKSCFRKNIFFAVNTIEVQT